MVMMAFILKLFFVIYPFSVSSRKFSYSSLHPGSPQKYKGLLSVSSVNTFTSSKIYIETKCSYNINIFEYLVVVFTCYVTFIISQQNRYKHTSLFLNNSLKGI